MKNQRHLLVLSFFLFLFNSCEQDNSSLTTQTLGENIAIEWELVSNVIGEKEGHKAKFQLKNNGNSNLSDDWILYFNMTPRTIDKEKIEGPASIEWINGDFFSLVPNAGFDLKPGETVDITYVGGFWMIKDNDAPAGLYFVQTKSETAEPEVSVVKAYTVQEFTRPDQTSRFTNDQAIVPTATTRYQENEQLADVAKDELFTIIPSPLALTKQAGNLEIKETITIACDEALMTEASYLKERLGEFFSGQVSIKNTSEAATIQLKKEGNGAKESYNLAISEEGAKITGVDEAGVFYGVQSLLSMLSANLGTGKQAALQAPFVSINDAPRFEYRGLHVDIARNFQPKPFVKKVIDAMAMYKLNTLHMHLTDDEGWRLQLNTLPELTEVGSKRGHTLSEDAFLQPAYGSGPIVGASTGSGFYTRADYIEILRYANDRHIEVITELNMPGHARAAIKSMEARYRRLMEAGKKAEAEEYLLSDFEDQSVYSSAQVFTDNVVCVCKESIYKFYETAVDEVIEIYKEANVPLTTIHTGGDEVPVGVWKDSPICKELMAREKGLVTESDLQNYFIGRIAAILTERGLVTAGWEEIVMRKLPEGGWIPNPEYANTEMLPYVWNNLWGNQDLGYRLANAGYPVVLCDVTNLYFDLAYDKDPKEPGLYWGGLVNTKKAFEFIPLDVFKSTKVNALEQPFDLDKDYAQMERLKPSAQLNIKGIQGQLWSETLRDPALLEYYLLPKMFGLAERAWAQPAPWETMPDHEKRAAAIDADWSRFAYTIGQKEMKRLDKTAGGFNYRIPLPGAVLEQGKLFANIAYPGLEIRYTLDGSEPTSSSILYTEPVDVTNKEVRLRTFDTRGRGSRTSIVVSKTGIKD